MARRGKIYYASIYNTCKCCAPIYLPLLISKNLTPLRALRFLEALIQGLSYYSNFRIHSFSASRASRQIGGLFRKVRFSETQVIIWVHENLGELTPAVFRDLRATPLLADILSARQRFLRSLRPFRGTHSMQGRKFTLFP